MHRTRNIHVHEFISLAMLGFTYVIIINTTFSKLLYVMMMLYEYHYIDHSRLHDNVRSKIDTIYITCTLR